MSKLGLSLTSGFGGDVAKLEGDLVDRGKRHSYRLPKYPRLACAKAFNEVIGKSIIERPCSI